MQTTALFINAASSITITEIFAKRLKKKVAAKLMFCGNPFSLTWNRFKDGRF